MDITNLQHSSWIISRYLNPGSLRLGFTMEQNLNVKRNKRSRLFMDWRYMRHKLCMALFFTCNWGDGEGGEKSY